MGELDGAGQDATAVDGSIEHWTGGLIAVVLASSRQSPEALSRCRRGGGSRGVGRQVLRLLLILVAGLGLATFRAPLAFAQPANDDFANATAISGLPFADSGDLNGATIEPDEPQFCAFLEQTVWYVFTPSSTTGINADLIGSDPELILNIYWSSGGGFGALHFINCIGSEGSRKFAAEAGTTYYMQVGSPSVGPAHLQLNVEEVPPPPNDDFANVSTISSLPFSDSQDLLGATVEAGEPSPGCFDTSQTVWYSFTPETTQSITATIDQYGAGVAAYTGNSLPDLSRVGCTYYYFQPLTFHAQAGTTYHFQVGAWCCAGPVTFRLDVAPNPLAQFYYYPSDPSSFDTIQFYDYSSDPAGVGISSWAWDFGDGGTSTQQSPTHKYAADGDYTVQLTVTTPDGRTDSTSQVVQVRTHDVAITRLAVPKSGHVGQTIAINVYVQNTHYLETVQATLSKSVPQGFSQVGSLTQSVPVKPAGQTTRFAFTYTVTSEDKAMGKITFRADALILDHRDALPADNQLSSTPVRIM